MDFHRYALERKRSAEAENIEERSSQRKGLSANSRGCGGEEHLFPSLSKQRYQSRR